MKSKSHSMTLDTALFPGTIKYLPDHRLLFCHLHKQVVSLPQLEAHLFRTHSVPKLVCRLLMEHCITLNVIKADGDIALHLTDHSLVIPALPLTKMGTLVSAAATLTISHGMVMKHLNIAHSIYHSGARIILLTCSCKAGTVGPWSNVGWFGPRQQGTKRAPSCHNRAGGSRTT